MQISDAPMPLRRSRDRLRSFGAGICRYDDSYRLGCAFTRLVRSVLILHDLRSMKIPLQIFRRRLSTG